MKEKERLSEEERKWRIQVMRRTAHICSPRAKELEREHYDHGHDPLVKWRELEEVLHGIDKVMEWRFVDPVGTVCLAPHMLSTYVDARTLQLMRECVVFALGEAKREM